MVFLNIIKKYIRYQQKQKAEREIEKNGEPEPEKLSPSLSENLFSLNERLEGFGDLKVREFKFGKRSEHSAAILFIDGLVDNMLIIESIMKPLAENKLPSNGGETPAELLKNISQTAVCSGEVEEIKLLSECIDGCLNGDTVLIIDGCDKGLMIGSKGYKMRTVTEPQTELVVRGPREGYTENLRTNTSLLRRKIKSPLLKIENMVIGKKSRTSVCIAYIKGVADENLLATVRKRLSHINVASILDTGYIEEYIEDAPFSIFPTVNYTEKPDVTAGRILEGRVAVLVDGSPFALTVPMLYLESFQTAEDYYLRAIYSSTIRILRFISYIIAIFTLPLFIALTTFHQEFIPTTLLFTFLNAREGTPFPAILEAFVLVLSFEILREAGLRLPRPVGQAISIVGALIMGEAAVAAGLVGGPMVIAVAITSVAGFVTPEQLDSVSILRLIMMILGSALGGFGLALGFLGMFVHLSVLKSFGVPYFDNIIFTTSMQDSLVRAPLWMMAKRPHLLAEKDETRMETFIPPYGKKKNEKVGVKDDA